MIEKIRKDRTPGVFTALALAFSAEAIATGDKLIRTGVFVGGTNYKVQRADFPGGVMFYVQHKTAARGRREVYSKAELEEVRAKRNAVKAKAAAEREAKKAAVEAEKEAAKKKKEEDKKLSGKGGKGEKGTVTVKGMTFSKAKR